MGHIAIMYGVNHAILEKIDVYIINDIRFTGSCSMGYHLCKFQEPIALSTSARFRQPDYNHSTMEEV